MDVEGSTAIVTGANRGLGKAIVAELLSRGVAEVYAGARDPEKVQATDPRVVPRPHRRHRPRLGVRPRGRWPTDVDLLVNNAGISDGTSVFGPDGVESLRRQLETNALGPLQMTRAFAPILESNGGGFVVNVLSVALPDVFFPSTSGYSASKAAAWSITNSTRGELKAQGTHVVGVHVGYLETDMAPEASRAPRPTRPTSPVRSSMRCSPMRTRCSATTSAAA